MSESEPSGSDFSIGWSGLIRAGGTMGRSGVGAGTCSGISRSTRGSGTGGSIGTCEGPESVQTEADALEAVGTKADGASIVDTKIPRVVILWWTV